MCCVNESLLLCVYSEMFAFGGRLSERIVCDGCVLISTREPSLRTIQLVKSVEVDGEKCSDGCECCGVELLVLVEVSVLLSDESE